MGYSSSKDWCGHLLLIGALTVRLEWAMHVLLTQVKCKYKVRVQE